MSPKIQLWNFFAVWGIIKEVEVFFAPQQCKLISFSAFYPLWMSSCFSQAQNQFALNILNDLYCQPGFLTSYLQSNVAYLIMKHAV